MNYTIATMEEMASHSTVSLTVAEFFSITKGSRYLKFSTESEPMCAHDFWVKYRGTPFWEAKIDCVDLIAQRAEQSGLWFDRVICVINLKENEGCEQ